MAKNYPPRRSSRYSKRRKSSSSNGLLWLIVLLLCACLVLGLVYLKNQHHVARHRVELAKKTAIAKVSASKPTAVNKESAPQPQFDFYTLLPKTQLPQPQVPTPSTKTLPPPPPIRYVLHIATLKNPQDVDHLKAELTLLGFDVALQTTPIKGESWTRIEVGPYTSLADAQADQDRLRKNSISSILAKVPAPTKH
jgi:cell division protein FtsN